ncbi:MAG: sigma-70 family RNA polymerase sigma factor [Myxococcota bacterium]
MPESDQELLAAARAGDDAALDALLERHQARIYRFGMKLCRDPEDAKDVLQDTLVAMARSVRDVEGRSSLSTWLYAVARSLCIKKRRRSKFAPEREASMQTEAAAQVARLPDTGPQPDEVAASREVAAALEAAIRQLPADQREVLVLRDIEGLKATEVGQVLELSVAAVKSRLHRARLQVRETVASELASAPLPPPNPGCPDVLLMYSKHLEGEISGALCAEMEAHIEQCPRCRGACDSLKETLSVCRSTPARAVPQAIQESVRAALRAFLRSA